MAWQTQYNTFREWVAEELKTHRGTRFSENGLEESSFVPLNRLQEFWEQDRIEALLEAPGHHRRQTEILSAEDIQQKFLRIFTALVYISEPDHSRVHYLDSFSKLGIDDDNLPIRKKDQMGDVFAGSYYASADKASFYESQFLFTPPPLGETVSGKLTRTMRQTHLTEIEVLPMTFERRIKPVANKDTSVEVILFKCHPTSGLTTRDGLVVAKVFPPEESEDAFANEWKTYTAVRSEDILAYFGSFVQCRRPVILLEYADKGSLVQFFQENSVPTTRDELTNMWTDLSFLFRGLAVLHNAQRTNPGAVTHVHQDLQPSNIFVFSDVTDRASGSHYKFRFKLGDFGSSSAKTRAEGRDLYYNKTPKVYGAPELMDYDPTLHNLDTVFTKRSDIWSIGCVLIEVALWSVGGERGRGQFLADRRAETTNEYAGIPACDSTFHNGKTILKTVRDRMDTVQSQLRVYDTLTKPLWEWICRYLLAHKTSHRLKAKQAGRLLRQLVDDARKVPPATFTQQCAAPTINEEKSPATKEPRPNSPGLSAGGLGGGHGGALSPIIPKIQLPGLPPGSGIDRGLRTSCDHILENPSDSEYAEEKSPRTPRKSRSHSSVGSYQLPIETTPTTRRPSGESQNPSTKSRRKARNRGSLRSDLTIDRFFEMMPTGLGDLPPELLGVQDQLQGRDQVFLIDDSWSMREHWSEVRRAVEVLGLVAQGADPDGMELRFTSRPAKKLPAKKATALVAHVEGTKPRHNGACPMEQALDTLIDDLMPRLRSVAKARVSLAHRVSSMLKPNSSATAKTGISVYVLTNAVWGVGAAGDGVGDDGRPRMFGVDRSVKTLVARLQRENAARSWFTLQFLRFGHDAAAKARLRYLDDGLKKEMDGWDAIDARSYNHSSVCSILIGALSEVNDDSDDSDD